MKEVTKIAFLMTASAVLFFTPALRSQPGAGLPSDDAYQAIQQSADYTGYAQPPSAKTYADLRAERPIDEVPIGGIDANAPDVSITVLCAFAICAAGISCLRKHYIKQKNENPEI